MDLPESRDLRVFINLLRERERERATEEDADGTVSRLLQLFRILDCFGVVLGGNFLIIAKLSGLFLNHPIIPLIFFGAVRKLISTYSFLIT